MNQTHMYQYRIIMEFHRSTSTTNDVQNSKFKNSFQPVDTVAEATNIIIKELSQVFMRDLKTKIIGPILYEFLDPSRFLSEMKSIKNDLTSRINNIKLDEFGYGSLNTNNIPGVETDKTNEPYSKINEFSFDGILKKFPTLPKFKKRVHENTYKGESLRDSLRRSKNVDARPLHHRLNDYSDSHDFDSNHSDIDKKDNDTSSDSKNNFLEQFHKRDGFSTNKQKYASYEDIDHIISDKTELKKHKRRNIDFTSSEDDSSLDLVEENIEETIESSDSETYEDDLSEYEEKPKKKRHQKKSKNKINKIDKNSPTNNESINFNEDHTISFTSTETLPLDDDDILLDIYGIQSIVKDNEDFLFLLEALESVESAKIDDIALWAWSKKEIKTSNVDGYPVVTKLPKDKGYTRINKSGAARTEGYFTIPDAEKSLYLPLRNKAIIPTDSLTTSITSRMNRINYRRKRPKNRRPILEAAIQLEKRNPSIHDFIPKNSLFIIFLFL
ncbi:hypothetical protein PCK1_000972 [Pneumocystis canis]|nr:hypothetical protein PCK1_000972 [Pneumocystis canis]